MVRYQGSFGLPCSTTLVSPEQASQKGLAGQSCILSMTCLPESRRITSAGESSPSLCSTQEAEAWVGLTSQWEPVQVTLEEHVGWEILLPSFRNSPTSRPSAALHYRLGVKPKLHVRRPGPDSLVHEQPLGPTSWFSNTWGSWSS